mgnify:FL=1|jgi:hypothetical protein|tara:strand:- start:223 stop:510 length:288 start_codon:yes stop_codon:yes gene_type:complete
MRISKNILEETINIVTGQRQEDYGDKITNHQNIANLWSSYLDKKISAHDVAICMLLVKVARLKNKKTHDCYIDMAGYAAIAGEINDSDSSIPTTE